MRNYMERILVMICACFLTLSFAKEKIDIISLDLQKDIQKKQLVEEFIDNKHHESVQNKLELIEKLNSGPQSKSEIKFQELYHEKIQYYNENGYPVDGSQSASVRNTLRCDYFTVILNDSYGDSWNGNILTIGTSSFTLDGLADDGSYAEFCYDGTSDVAVTCDGGSWQSEVSWSIVDVDGNIVFEGGAPFSGCWGTCSEGCTDANADNYDPGADFDDGSCDYGCETNQITLVVDGGLYQTEVSWEFSGTAGGAPSTNIFCLEDGDYSFTGCDSYGDGWNGNLASFYEDGQLIANWDGPDSALGAGECETVTISIGVEVIAGCTDVNACNYDSASTIDDGSCWYPQAGCSCDSGDSDGDGICDDIDNCDGGVVDACGECGGDGTACAGCAYPQWYDDNYCDSSNNNAECGYDGGDCCPGDCLIGGYNNPGSYTCEGNGGTCPECLDPNSADNAEGGECADYVIGCAETTCGDYIGFGYTCQEAEGFGYDCSVCQEAGECPAVCEDEGLYTCWDGSCAVSLDDCPDASCQEAGGYDNYISDGYCDNANNIPECNYDGGDCCGSTCVATDSYDCQGGTTGSSWAACLSECLDPNANDDCCADQSCDFIVDTCTDGEVDNTNPCNPLECYDGVWYEIVIDCAEQMGVPCEGGEYVPPAEGECCSTCVEFECLPGDVTGDEAVNVLDIVAVVGYILNGGDDFAVNCADVTGDGAINVLDIVAIVNSILGGRSVDASSVRLIKSGSALNLSADGFIGGVQMTLSHGSDFSIELTDRAMVADYRTEGNETTLIIVAPESDELFIADGEYEIVDVIIANSGGEMDVVKPSSFELSEAYPNPFNPSTSINLSVPEAGHVSVMVYNVMGQSVSTLADGHMNASDYSFTWDASAVPSGVYLITAAAENHTSTQKVMLLK